MGKIKIVIISILVLGVILVGYFFADINGMFSTNKNVSIIINKGEGISVIANKLKKEKAISNKVFFKLYANLKYKEKFDDIKPGGLDIEAKSSYKKILDNVVDKERKMDQISITIPEGYEFREIADVLEKNQLINREEFYKIAKSYDFKYGFLKDLPKTDNRLEGYLFPDTYMFSKTLDDELSIITKMLNRFEDIYKKYENKAIDSGKTTHEVITLASVIEREGGNKEDFKIVSSVFNNRLRRTDNLAKLQSCATVQYILEERKAVLSLKDTQIDSPYNTYKYKGLPKGPISSPGESAIEAAINPDKTEYLYFLNDSSGKLHFSKTYEEHQAFMKKYNVK